MSVTGKKKRKRSGQKQSPEKQYALVYLNKKPNRVKPKKEQTTKSPKTPKPDPVSFVMQHEYIYVTDDDTI